MMSVASCAANIYCIGDANGGPQLAHAATAQAVRVVDNICNKERKAMEALIPACIFTAPEVGAVGLTEQEAKEQGISFETANFPWAASGRAIASAATNGMTKLIFDKDTHRIIGGAIVGTNAGEMLGEIGLAIEMGADAEDIALTIHAHPTLNESIGLAAEMYEGSITDLPNPKAKKKK